MTDAGLKELQAAKSLNSFNLVACHEVTDAGLQNLTGLPDLSAVSLRGSKQITDAGVKSIESALPNAKISR